MPKELEKVEAYPVWEVDCPKCSETQEQQYCDGDLMNEDGEKHTCEYCSHVFLVVKPE
jgi:hypothetical protein